MIGRKEAVKNGVDCHSVNLIFSEEPEEGKICLKIKKQKII